jgi:hypothetical protein
VRSRDLRFAWCFIFDQLVKVPKSGQTRPRFSKTWSRASIIYEECVLGKHPQEKFDKGKTQRASSPLDMINSDLMGPFQNPSINKARYVLIFAYDLSRFTWIFFLRKKSEVFQHLKYFKAMVETQSGKKIKVLRTNNEGKYVNHEI